MGRERSAEGVRGLVLYPMCSGTCRTNRSVMYCTPPWYRSPSIEFSLHCTGPSTLLMPFALWPVTYERHWGLQILCLRHDLRLTLCPRIPCRTIVIIIINITRAVSQEVRAARNHRRRLGRRRECSAGKPAGEPRRWG